MEFSRREVFDGIAGSVKSFWSGSGERAQAGNIWNIFFAPKQIHRRSRQVAGLTYRPTV